MLKELKKNIIYTFQYFTYIFDNIFTRMNLKDFILFFFLSLAQFSFGQYTKDIIIEGRVLLNEDLPLDLVTITDLRSHRNTQTDENGDFQLRLPLQNDYRIAIIALGYKDKIINLKISDTKIRQIIYLEPIEHELGEVNVDGRTMTTVRERLQMLEEQRPASANVTGGIEDYLTTLGGVSSRNELSSQYNVRGGNFDENLVYVNGIQIFRPFLVRNAQQEGLSFIEPLMIEEINFSRGGFNAEYGDKMSSVLDIEYKKQTRPFEGTVQASFLGGKAYVGSTTEKFTQVSAIRYKSNQSLLKTGDTKAEYDPKFIDAQTFATFRASENWELSFLGNYSKTDYKYIPQSRETTFGTTDKLLNFNVNFKGQEKDQFVTYQGGLSSSHTIGEHTKIKLVAGIFSSSEFECYDIEGKYNLANVDANASTSEIIGLGSYHEFARNSVNSKIYNVQASAEHLLGKHTIKWGVTAQIEDIDTKINEWQIRDSIGYSLGSIQDGLKVNYSLQGNHKIKANRYSGYMQDTYRLETDPGLWIINAGIRVSHWNFNKETTISPRGTVAFIPKRNEYLTFRFSTGMYYQAPLYNEVQKIVQRTDGFSYVELNNTIKSEKSIQFVLGNDFHFTASDKKFKLTTELFYKKLSDINPYTVSNVKIRYLSENIGKGYIMGIDTRLYGEFVKGVDSWVSLSLMKTNQNLWGIDMPLPTDQLYNISLFLQDYMPGYERLSVNLKAVFSGGLPFTTRQNEYNTNLFRYPHYMRFDMGFAWQLLGEDFSIRDRNVFIGTFRDIWLGIDCFNLMNIQNTNTYYWISDVNNTQFAIPNYGTGRQFSLKLIANF